jgi:hypothetical protein
MRTRELKDHGAFLVFQDIHLGQFKEHIEEFERTEGISYIDRHFKRALTMAGKALEEVFEYIKQLTNKKNIKINGEGAFVTRVSRLLDDCSYQLMIDKNYKENVKAINFDDVKVGLGKKEKEFIAGVILVSKLYYFRIKDCKDKTFVKMFEKYVKRTETLVEMLKKADIVWEEEELCLTCKKYLVNKKFCDNTFNFSKKGECKLYESCENVNVKRPKQRKRN